MIPTFKIRCSAIGQIMGGIGKPTEKQMKLLQELQDKPKRTALQEATLQELISKRDAKPMLQAGAKTYCKNWLKEQIYGYKKEFTSKYTEKGIKCEQEGIDLIAEMMGYGMVTKNEQHFEDDDITGTPDLIVAEFVEDDKCPWSPETFPLFETEIPESDYFYQLQGYMALTGKKRAALNYTLIDAPSEIIDSEARKQAYKLGMTDIEMELYDEVVAKMTYTHIPKKLKHKRWEFERDEAVISAIRGQVKLCREYIETLLNEPTIKALIETLEYNIAAR